MQQRQLGTTGLSTSLVGLGCNNFGGRLDLEQSRKVVHRALDLGINFFDTADVYGGRGPSESFLSEILGSERQNVIIATKFGNPMDEAGKQKGASRRYIFQAVHASLKRLKTDYIDLYQLHKPDPLTPLEETLSALDDLVRQGLVRYIGCSNLPAWQVVESQWISKTRHQQRFVSAQDEYSLLFRSPEKDLLKVLDQYGLGLLPYFPLASGLLTGKYHQGQPLPEGSRFEAWKGLGDRYLTEHNWSIVEDLRTFSEARGRTLLELAFSWLAAQKTVSSIIAGATRPEQVEQNVQAVNWALSGEDLAEIDRITASALHAHG